MNDNHQSFPLDWPLGYKRTNDRKNSFFKQSMDASQRSLEHEVRLLEGSNLVVSTNLPVRNDGGIYAAYMDKLIDDPGVAVFFRYKGKSITMCCDQYRRVWENIYALAKGIEALRGMDRWGVSEFLERAFTGFTALPPAQSASSAKTWNQILEIPEGSSASVIKEAYRQLVKMFHPDNTITGSAEKFIQVQSAYEDAKNRGLVNG